MKYPVQIAAALLGLCTALLVRADQATPVEPCLKFGAIFLTSSDVLTVRGCARRVPSPIADQQDWWQFEADDRKVNYIVRADQIVGVSIPKEAK